MTDTTPHPPPTASPGPGNRVAQRARTREKLLDAAETLFARNGYRAVTVRDITTHAGTRLAAVNDHFGTKDNLFRDVLLRRVTPLNAHRRALLTTATARQQAHEDRLAGIIDAFTRPMLERASSDTGWRHHFRFAAQLSHSRLPQQLLVADEYDSIARHFITHLRDLSPDAPEEALHDAYLFMLASALQVFADSLRLDSISKGRYHSDDFTARHAALTRFLHGGMGHLITPTP
ncbi:TetR/AcrR family transcriptional regulator [Streptomyces bacillaris]|uniref:TetR/AcrR family transcriptional regulator n=1 Tax=unclassified Streptomyces TaxID=2593676 RepID=UPI00037C74DA|nr:MULTISPECIES: TetR/AcrR family transcriptional regulator [unclassified Streptomyces]MYT37629.1 TetR family transcriptional regulator [Streptomyces sp. SID8356]